VRKRDPIEKLTAGHTDLNVFAIVVTILEGGHLYDAASERAATRIITACKREQQRLLRLYDEGVFELCGDAPPASGSAS
jgi:hypothetical protein